MAIVTARTQVSDSAKAGAALGRSIHEGLSRQRPDVAIVFASPRHDCETLLGTLNPGCEPKVLTGCSSAGELTEKGDGTASACAIAIKSNHMRFSVGMGRGVSGDRRQAADDIFSTPLSAREFGYEHRYGLVLTDALGGYVEDLMDVLSKKAAGSQALDRGVGPR